MYLKLLDIWPVLFILVLLTFLSGAPLLTEGDQTDGDSNTAVTLVADSTVDEQAPAGESVKDVDNKDNDDDDYIDPNAEPFIPTHEWQIVKRGQSIPGGLHVRMNLQTKTREAKLMDGDDGAWLKGTKKQEVDVKMSDRVQVMKQGIEDAMKDLQEEKSKDLKFVKMDWKDGGMNREELKEALKKFESNKDDVKSPELLPKQTYRNTKELKKEMEALNLEAKSDGEIILEYLRVYNNPETTDEAKVGLLNNLEYYLHQIDNGVDFIDMGGLGIIIRDLNHTSPDIRSEAALVLGSVAQSNPQVQHAAFKDGALKQLTRLLSLETSPTVLSRGLYALSSCIRSRPQSQDEFFNNGGFHSLTRLFDGDISTVNNIEKAQLKALTLIEDLLEERKLFEKYFNQSDLFQYEKSLWYEKVDFTHLLVGHQWCQHISSLLSLSSHDSREKVMRAMQGIIGTCNTQDVHVRQNLKKLQAEYSTLAKEELSEPVDERYFTQLLEQVNLLLKVFKPVNVDL